MKTGIITTDTYLNHNTGHGHPERADRVTVVIDHLKKIIGACILAQTGTSSIEEAKKICTDKFK